jgi:hypothetical protein
MAVKTLSNMALVLVVLGAARCGGTPLQVRKGGSAGNDGTSGAAGGGGSEGGGSGGKGGSATPPGCGNAPCPTPAGPCDMLLDETSCSAHLECRAEYCPDCHGGQNFVTCSEPDGGVTVGCGPCPPDCSTLDETSCKANGYCHPGYCLDCKGGQMFATCLGPNEQAACANACPIMPAPCTTLDEVACLARGDCQAEYCNSCQRRTFVGCGAPGTAFVCEGPAGCPAVIPCANVTDQLSCDARSDCHSVFGGNWHNCPSTTSNCPVNFTSCADGGKASCKAPTALCAIEPPPCEASGYVTSYVPTCYEGCVRAVECGP